MPLFDNVRLLGSAFLPRSCHLHGLATAGAILTCMAVVVDVGQFAKAQKTSVVPTEQTEQAAVRIVTEQPDTRGSFSPGSQNVSAPVRELMQMASISVGGIAPWTIRTASAKDATESDARPPREHAGSAEPATPPDQASSELAKSDLFVGVWAPDALTCSARNFRDGDLPTVISTDGAWAGETFCMFTKKKQTESGWRLVAKCSSPRERWTANVRLTVNDSRLTWSSERGSQVYTRCTPDLLTAQAR
jgi:hypothetical protein